VTRHALGAVVLLLGFGRALAQTSMDTLAAVETGAAEKSVAGAARGVTQSAIGAVFGAPPSAAPPGAAAAAPAAIPPADGRPVAAPPQGAADAPRPSADGVRFDGQAPAGDPPSEEAAAAAAQAMAIALAQRGRDPFRPFTLDLRPENTENEILTPLQRFELPQLRLAGVVLNLRPPRAMLQDNSGMGFIVTPGTPIGRRHGVVKAIEARRVVVEEHVLDYYGREQVHQVVIEMPKDTRQASAGQE
jgi:hypothetical protein